MEASPEPASLPLKPRRNRRPLLVLASVGVVLSGVLYLMADSAGFEYYKHVDEVAREPGRWAHKRLQMHGFVVPGSVKKRIDRDHQKLEYKFQAENCGAVVNVRFAGVVPDTFKEGAEVVLKGEWMGDGFQTQEVMAKCPSKYSQAGEAQNAMLTRCTRDAQSAIAESKGK